MTLTSEGVPNMTQATWPADATFEEFIALHQQQLLRAAYLVTGSRVDAEDAVQSAAIAVARRWSGIQAGARFTYFRRAAINEALLTLRRRREVTVGLDPGGRSEIVDGGLLRFEEDQLFFGRLLTLPAKQRAAVVLRYFCDLPDADIARHLRCTEATVRSQVHRALDRLRALEVNQENL